MDKNPKHPLKKKKVMPKVCATANHNADQPEMAASSKKNHSGDIRNALHVERTCGAFLLLVSYKIFERYMYFYTRKNYHNNIKITIQMHVRI